MSTLNPELPRSAAGRYNPWLVAVVASIATFMEVLDTTVASVSLYHIASSMGVSYNEALWVITSYIVANALILPVSGWLANTLGRKRYYMISVALFTLASLLCSIAPTLEWLILARVLQGIGGGGLAPVEQSILVDSFSEKQRPQAFALYGVAVLLAPAIGPLVGGGLTDALSWHWVFLINVPVGLLSLLLCYYLIDEPPLMVAERKQRLADGIRIDYIGLLLIVLGFSALQLCLDRFDLYDGFASQFIVICAVIAGVCLTFLPLWEGFHPRPMLDVRLFLQPNFAIGSLLMFLVGFLVVSTTQLLPQMTQELMGYDAWTAGLTLGAGGLCIMLAMMVTGAIASKLTSQRFLVVAGLGFTAFAMWHFSKLSLQVDFATLMWARVLQMIGLPMILIPVAALSYRGLAANKSNEASAMSTLLRNLGGSIGIAWVVNLLHQRTHLHYERLGEHITAANTPAAMLKSLAQALYQQARMLSYLDIYTIMALVALSVMLLPLFFREK
ncbi:DHA2 family efflux MFS transporter permease subunit [Erwiniaceae bacterium BAC15a-03b]|uniref:DHA2 family efflux MFS transporter permease subunit n=1 Tax=Winslowiella arboricola TaxID=2978220 RepID=A0A9J6PSH5_9GAMM|nr:DHA2 family efflux MFS transporter permease subunit [Winslowiella arboricola]MCU5775496.1 DHA2 family efflux MFS transporter permease subunit [Winslowiella arboricola]MCU5779654.1 DHA2 family efflux MFS transporter permease subunit [Winslowiella arboricola]